jgi:DNA-directed RNA polymerase specialized sigma24 family protein
MTDQAAFLDATLPHLDAVWNAARRTAPDTASTDDLVQETYLQAFRSSHNRGRRGRRRVAAVLDREGIRSGP